MTMSDDVRYPDISVRLIGYDGNGFMIVGRVAAAMRAAKVPVAEINEFRDDAMSGDYEHLLTTVERWVEVE